MSNPKNFNKGIKKLNESDLNKVSGGQTYAKSKGTFSRKKIFTACDTCGDDCQIKLTKKDIDKWYGMGDASTGAQQRAEIVWTCKNCGGKNCTRLERHGGLFFPCPFAHWYGHTNIEK